MTVKQLRETIKGVPDDYRIILDNGEFEANDNNEVVCAVTYDCVGPLNHPKVVVLKTKDDIDIKEDIESTIKIFMTETSRSVDEIFEMLALLGYKERDYNKCDQWVRDLYNKIRKEETNGRSES